MALLKRSLNDDHLFLRGAGTGRRGTWQIGQEGEDWLLQQHYSLPAPGFGIRLSQAEIMRLEQYLYTLESGRISKRRAGSDADFEREKAGLPLLLRLGGRRGPVAPWTMGIELAKLIEIVQKDRTYARMGLAGAIVHGTLSASPSKISALQLQDVSFWPQVIPQREPYQIFWLDNQGHQYEFSATGGLQEGWQGNIFVSSKDGQLAGTWWRRCLPFASIAAADCEEFYWLAQPGYDPEWPGSAQRVREPFRGWQLWRLRIDSITSMFWEEIERWLGDREIDLAYPAWRLRVLNPFSFATSGRHIIPSGQPLFVQCYPPRRQPSAMSENVRLVVAPLQRSTGHQYLQQFTPVSSAFLQPDQENYFNLRTSHEAYRVSLSGEARGASLQLEVAPVAANQPSWLGGLRCSIEGTRSRRTLHAFSNSLLNDQLAEIRIPEDFSAEEVANLNWTLEPVGIPFSWEWQYDHPHKPRYRDRLEYLQTDSNLSQLWRERIWPSVVDSLRAEMIFDAGSFGRVELTLVCRPANRPDRIWWEDKQLLSQFIWLSNLSEMDMPGQIKRPVPADLREWLLRARQIIEVPVALSTALERLAALEYVPIWMLVRLQAMLTKIQQKYATD